MKFKSLVKGALNKQLMKGVAAKGSVDDIVYGEYFKRAEKAIVRGKLSAVDVRIFKGLLKQAKGVRVKNEWTENIIIGLEEALQNRRKLGLFDIIFIRDELIPYLHSCQDEFRGKELEAIKPILDKTMEA